MVRLLWIVVPLTLLSIPAFLFLFPGRRGERPAHPDTPVEVADAGHALPQADAMENLARTDPVAFIENCLRRYQREVRGYRATMQKQERINGTLNPVEIIEVHFREQPHSVLMIWKQGVRLAERAIYVEGENNGMLLARPQGGIQRFFVGDIVEREVNGKDARDSGRYTMAEFGLKKGTQRVLAGLRAAQDRGDLRVEYLGIQKPKEVGERPCYVLRRSLPQPDEEGTKTVTIYVDTKTWLQVGSILEREDGTLVAAYYFRDVELNPAHDPQRFTRAALAP